MEKKKLIQIIKKVINRSTLPILEDVHFIDTHIEVSDLETFVRLPYKTGIETCTPADTLIKAMNMMKEPQFTKLPDREIIVDHFKVNGVTYLGKREEKEACYLARMKRIVHESGAVTWEDFKDIYPTFEAYMEAEETPATEDFNPRSTLPVFDIEVSEGKRKVKMAGENPDDYPVNPIERETFVEIGRLNEAGLDTLETVLRFASNDDLRPAMTGVCFDREFIVATDANRLFYRRWTKIGVDAPMEEFILAPKAAKILVAIGGEWKIFAQIEDNSSELKEGEVKVHKYYTLKRENNNIYRKGIGSHNTEDEFEADGETPTEKAKWDRIMGVVSVVKNVVFYNETEDITVITRVIDAKFPDFRVVLPEGEGEYRLFTDKSRLVAEMKNAVSFANKSTNQVVFTLNGNISIHAQDVDFGYEYDYTFADTEAEYQANTPIPAGEQFRISFNGNFIAEIAKELPGDEAVKMKFWSPTKATIINDEFLVMPLLLNS